MAEFPYMPFWTDAYLADTRHLSTLEHGAYLLLLITAWRSKEKCLPDDDKLLARYAGLTAAQWKRIGPTIRAFFTVENEQLFQSRLTREAVAVKQKQKSQSRNARAKHQKNKKTDPAVAESGSELACAKPVPNPATYSHSHKERKNRSHQVHTGAPAASPPATPDGASATLAPAPEMPPKPAQLDRRAKPPGFGKLNGHPADFSDPENRKDRREQKILTYIGEQLPSDQATELIAGYLVGEGKAKAEFERMAALYDAREAGHG